MVDVGAFGDVTDANIGKWRLADEVNRGVDETLLAGLARNRGAAFGGLLLWGHSPSLHTQQSHEQSNSSHCAHIVEPREQIATPIPPLIRGSWSRGNVAYGDRDHLAPRQHRGVGDAR